MERSLSYRYAPANAFHRVELDKNIPYCWTLFIPSLSYKDWGFKTNNGWVQHEEYFNIKNEKNNQDNENREKFNIKIKSV